MLLAAFFTYYYTKSSVYLSCEYEKYSIKKTYDKVISTPAVRPPAIEGRSGLGTILTLLLGDTRQVARFVFIILTSIVPFVTMSVGFISLFVIDWLITLLLLPTSLIYFFFMYRMSNFAISNSRDHEKYKEIVKGPLNTNLNSSAKFEPAKEFEKVVDEKHIDSYIKSYGGIIELTFKSSFFSDIFTSIELVIVLFSLSLFAILNKSNWEIIPVYLVALRFMVNNLKTFSSKVNVANRFYPQAKRYFDFWNHLNNYDSRLSQPIVIKTKDNSSVIESNFFKVFSYKRINKYKLHLVLENIVGPSNKYSYGYIDSVDFNFDIDEIEKYLKDNICSLELLKLFNLNETELIKLVSKDKRSELENTHLSIILNFCRGYQFQFITARSAYILECSMTDLLNVMSNDSFLVVLENKQYFTSQKDDLILFFNNENIEWHGKFVDFEKIRSDLPKESNKDGAHVEDINDLDEDEILVDDF